MKIIQNLLMFLNNKIYYLGEMFFDFNVAEVWIEKKKI